VARIEWVVDKLEAVGDRLVVAAVGKPVGTDELAVGTRLARRFGCKTLVEVEQLQVRRSNRVRWKLALAVWKCWRGRAASQISRVASLLMISGLASLGHCILSPEWCPEWCPELSHELSPEFGMSLELCLELYLELTLAQFF